ncbi:sulfite exporter TauE/SafE family protein [Tropicimonas marinistellae]|uniref:sulfite exporter TauE/SafE family protein n=1 Tax=Tropicimonas marinistellae TaxID=1739787 RepID=UPI0008317BED|nr:sulfite exporter TauE/SafE family protein [Tropicimonas marinistellae]
MPEALSAALAQPGLGWLMLIIAIGGVVRGFAGFGVGLVFIPLAATILPPIWVLVAITVADIVGALPLVPRALRDGSGQDVGVMALGCVVVFPFAILLLEQIDPDLFRRVAAGVSLGLLTILISGWRHSITFRRPALAGIGGAAGLMGGLTGLPGPPMILAFMSGQYRPEQIRGNTILFLLCYAGILVVTYQLRGLLDPTAVAIGLLLIPPYVAGSLLGTWFFDPARARLYRLSAYGIIAASAVLSQLAG